MKANDCLRRVRYILELDDTRMMATFAEGGQVVDRQTISAWLKREEDPGYMVCEDRELASFLNGLIIVRRGRRPGPVMPPEQRLTNNLVLKKLKIAFSLDAEEILVMLAEQAIELSKHELSALFRNPSNRQYRECKDQVLRNLLLALQNKYRPEGRLSSEPDPNSPWSQAQSDRPKPS